MTGTLVINPDPIAKRKPRPKTRAIKIFESGPAAATMASPQRWFLKLYGLKGTGFAQPIIKPAPEMERRGGKITEPNGSRCFSGFSVSRPSYFAVESPSQNAA